MADKPESPWSRMKRFALWQWGLLFISGGLVASMLSGLIQSPAGRTAAQRRAEALGSGAGAVLLILTGVVLIVVHFVKRKPPS